MGDPQMALWNPTTIKSLSNNLPNDPTIKSVKAAVGEGSAVTSFFWWYRRLRFYAC